MSGFDLDRWHMTRALALAARGRGSVEPNPLVGCIIAHGAEIVGEGWHRRYGGPHAEVEALAIAGQRAQGATLYVTLEPCCHFGKTPPCTDAIVQAGIARVVAAQRDPFEQVAGEGESRLLAAGIRYRAGVCEAEARQLNAPYLKLLKHGLPWIIAKWAMTLDGKIASHTGSSRWISSEASRALVHKLRGKVDAVVVGIGTVLADDPLLTARPAGARVATRVVLDSEARLPANSQLVRTAAEAPVLVAVADSAPAGATEKLVARGCEVVVCPGDDRIERLRHLLAELGRRRMTNALVEGGGQILGSFLDAGLIDEVHAFIAPRLLGGQAAWTPVAGQGFASVGEAMRLERVVSEVVDGDTYLHGFVTHPAGH